MFTRSLPVVAVYQLTVVAVSYHYENPTSNVGLVQSGHHRLAWNQNNVLEWMDMFTRGLLLW
jgi:hypothetical protein